MQDMHSQGCYGQYGDLSQKLTRTALPPYSADRLEVEVARVGLGPVSWSQECDSIAMISPFLDFLNVVDMFRRIPNRAGVVEVPESKTSKNAVPEER
jgi:hypothetical protein